MRCFLVLGLICGAVAELVERTRAFRVSAGESWRRLVGLPRGAWGMTLAHFGLGVFILGACYETGWKAEAAEALAPGGSLNVGAYHLVLDQVSDTLRNHSCFAAAGARKHHQGATAVCGRLQLFWIESLGETTHARNLLFSKRGSQVISWLSACCWSPRGTCYTSCHEIGRATLARAA